MDSFYTITSYLDSTGLYNIVSGSNIYNEIKAYSCVLDETRDLLEETLNECFVSSSNSFGLENREKMFGNTRSDYSNEERRSMIIYRRTLGENDFTKSGLEKFLTSFGVKSYSVLEMPDLEQIAIYIYGDFSDVDIAWIKNEITLVLPAHLDFDIYFNGISWDSIDNKNLTFQDMDDYDYTWEEIHNLV